MEDKVEHHKKQGFFYRGESSSFLAALINPYLEDPQLVNTSSYPEDSIKKIPAKEQAREPKLLSIKETALYLGIPIWRVRQLIWNNKIPFIQTGNGGWKKYYIAIEDLDNWIARNKINQDDTV